jgi:hypothetical protein
MFAGNFAPAGWRFASVFVGRGDAALLCRVAAADCMVQ